MNFALRSIPQMGGTSTTQQAIYLVHGNPCGINPFLLNRIGITDYNYIELNAILRTAINDANNEIQNIIDAFQIAQEDPTEQNYLRLYLTFYQLGQAVWSNLSTFVVEGYTPILTVYDEEGRTFFDSSLKEWPPVTGDENVLIPVNILLVPTTLSLPGPVGTFYLNSTGSETARLYNLSKTPSYLSYIVNAINPQVGRSQAEIFNSGFLLNQAQMFESLMASSSLLTDTANTRFFNEIGSGFSARPVTRGQGNLGYYTCIIKNLSNVSRIVNQNIFIRLGIEKNIVE
jgi:hypothetical protein